MPTISCHVMSCLFKNHGLVFFVYQFNDLRSLLLCTQTLTHIHTQSKILNGITINKNYLPHEIMNVKTQIHATSFQKHHPKLMAKVKQEFSGSFEMINNDIEQDFSASNGSGNNQQIPICFLFFYFYFFVLFRFV